MALTETQIRQLARIQHYATRYELAAVRGNERVLICYTERKNRSGLWSAISSNRAEPLCRLTGAEEITFGKRAADGGMMGDWKIVFTGRTQRPAILAGELPFLLDLSPIQE